MATINHAADANAPQIDVLVGERIHTLMWRNRVLNKDLADALNLDPTAIGKKLRAEQKFSIEQLYTIARTLGTSIAYLVGETSNPSPVGPTGIEPMTSTVESGRLAPVTPIFGRTA